MKKDLIEVTDLSKRQILDLLSLAFKIKKNPKKYSQSLNGKILALIFKKPSTRTRVSFESGMIQLGGAVINLTSSGLQISRGESIKDTAKTLSGYIDAIMIRTTSDEEVMELAKESSVPVINGLSKSFHPCQVLSDIFTVCEKKGLNEKTVYDFDWGSVKMVFMGDSNNVSRSLANLSSILKFRFGLICPDRFLFERKFLDGIKKKNRGFYFSSRIDSNYLSDAEFIYTDVWTSMGDEKESALRKKVFSKYQVNSKLLEKASKNVFVMHCLPAMRGQEITDEVMDSPRSIVFEQAHNRMHFQKALLYWLLK